jgi:hypothetical protein
MLNEIAENDPFADFESTGEVVAFVRRKHGETAVRELLAMMNEPVPAQPWLLPQDERLNITTRERLERTARELKSRGLKRLAKMVRGHALSRPSELDLSPYEPGTLDHQVWLACMKRRRKK